MLKSAEQSAQPDEPVRFKIDGEEARFWPPKANGFWSFVLRPVERYYARSLWKMAGVKVTGLDGVMSRVGPADGLLVAPNHSFEGDAYVLRQCARRCGKFYYFMADWRAFLGNGGLNGWLLPRLGVFSVDRDGSDRKALKQAIDLLASRQCLVVFPEGEIHHLNQRLTPILDGVAFMAVSAQKQLTESAPDARVWMAPAAIRYRCDPAAVRPKLEAIMADLERRLVWVKPPRGASLRQRIVYFGEILLTLKEKEKLGRSCEDVGDLPARIGHLMESLLARHEAEYLGKTPAAETVTLRAKLLRRCLNGVCADPDRDAAARQKARDVLGDVQMALQLYSYPGNYIAGDDDWMPMVETIEKFREDVLGDARPVVPRRAHILFGPPIDMKEAAGEGRLRTVVASVTDRVEKEMERLLVEAGQGDW